MKEGFQMLRDRTALIFGVTGQDGSYLAEYLLSLGYNVHGVKRRSSTWNTSRVDHLYQDPHLSGNTLQLHYGDLTDSLNILQIIEKVKPDEIYNLAAQSHVHISFEIPEYTSNADGLGALRILEGIKTLGLNEHVKFLQAGTSEMYGKVLEIPQNEKTPFNPTSPYAISKVYAHWITKNYRDSYGFFASNAISFNHESPRRGENFVTRKISKGLANIRYGLSDCLYLGNLSARRDWGHAKDFVIAQWKILQHSEADDFVLSTGVQFSVRDFVNMMALAMDMEIEWEGNGLDEVAIWQNPGDHGIKGKMKEIIRIDPNYFRPSEVQELLGDSTKASKLLNWKADTTIDQLVKEMAGHELLNASKVRQYGSL